MKKQFLYISAIAFLSIFTTVNVYAQAPKETQVTYMKKVTNAYAKEFNISKGDLEDVVEKYFKDNFKGKRLKSNGYYLYKGVDWAEVSTEKLDVYYKVGGGKRNATLTIMVSKGYDNFISSQSSPQISAEVMNFLNTFQVKIDDFNRKATAAALAKEIEKKEKDLKSFDKEEKKLQDKIKDIEKDIERNAKKRAEAIDNLEKEKARLQSMQ